MPKDTESTAQEFPMANIDGSVDFELEKKPLYYPVTLYSNTTPNNCFIRDKQNYEKRFHFLCSSKYQSNSDCLYSRNSLFDQFKHSI